MAAVARLASRNFGAPGDDLFAEIDEGLRKSLRFIISGRPPFSAIMLAGKFDCSA